LIYLNFIDIFLYRKVAHIKELLKAFGIIWFLTSILGGVTGTCSNPQEDLADQVCRNLAYLISEDEAIQSHLRDVGTIEVSELTIEQQNNFANLLIPRYAPQLFKLDMDQNKKAFLIERVFPKIAAATDLYLQDQVKDTVSSRLAFLYYDEQNNGRKFFTSVISYFVSNPSNNDFTISSKWISELYGDQLFAEVKNSKRRVGLSPFNMTILGLSPVEKQSMIATALKNIIEIERRKKS